MRWRFLFLALTLFGLILIAYSVISGRSSFALLLIFPVVYGSDPLLLLGILLIFAGTFLFFYYPPYTTDYVEVPMEEAPPPQEGEVEKKFGMVVLIGPIPIIVGSDKRMALLSLLSVVVIILAIILLTIYG